MAVDILKHLSIQHLEMLDDRAKRERRKIRERAYDYDRSDEQNHKQRTVCRQGARGYRNEFLCCQAARYSESGNDEQESGDQHIDAERQVVPGSVGIDAAERAAVIAGSAGVGIQDFRKPM